MQKTLARIHPTAVIDPEARIAEDVTVGPYSIIGPHVKIGAGCRIAGHVLIEGYTELGEENSVFHGAAIGSAPQDFSYRGQESYVRIGHGNTIREFVTVHAGSHAGTDTRIGDANLLMAYVHIAHNCMVGSRTVLANAVNLAGHVTVEDYAIIGGVTPVHQFVRIGCHSIVGGGSRVPQDVAPYTKIAGNPPKCYGLNGVGLSRRGFSPETLEALRRVHRIFFRSHLGAREAADRIEAEITPLPEVLHFLEFVRQQGRGITR